MWGFFSSDPAKGFPFEIGEKVSGIENKSIWSLHHGKKKATGEAVSIFAFEVKGSSETLVELAKACFKRVKTLRHPNMLTYLDGLETDKILYIVTEQITPLHTYLVEGQKDGSKALSFMVNDCAMIHNNVCISSIFVNKAGDWLLGGVDFSYKIDGNSTISVIRILPELEKYDPPEKSQTVVRGARWAIDSWGLGCLIWETFNGSLPRSSSLKAIGKVPKSLISNYCELVGANPKSRPNPAKFIDSCRVPGGFMHNSFIDTMLFLEEIQIKDQAEKTAFFQKLTPSLDSFPSQICRHKLLPQLVHAFEYGNSGAAVLAPLLKVGKALDTADYQKTIIPCVVKLFSSPDRNTRVKLLQQIETFVEHLQSSTVNDQIFPHIVQGFTDSNPVVRECTIKAMTHMASKLNYKNLNEEIMKHFARLQTKDDQDGGIIHTHVISYACVSCVYSAESDFQPELGLQEGGIRTNTTICLGKIATFINPTIRQKILISAFVRATKDPFPPARQAGILAMAATQQFYYIKEIALKLLPTLCCLTLDPDKGVRDQAFKAMHGFIGKLEKVSEDPSSLEEIERSVVTGGTSAEGVSGWAGWAVSGMSSLTSRLYNKSHRKQPSKSPSPQKEESQTPTKPIADTTNETTEDSPVAPDNTNDGWEEDWGDIDNLDQEDHTPADSQLQDNRNDNEEDDASDWGDDDNVDWGSLEANDSTHTEAPPFEPQLTASSYFTKPEQGDDFFSNMITNDKKSTNTSTRSSQNRQQQTQQQRQSLEKTPMEKSKQSSNTKVPTNSTLSSSNSNNVTSSPNEFSKANVSKQTSPVNVSTKPRTSTVPNVSSINSSKGRASQTISSSGKSSSPSENSGFGGGWDDSGWGDSGDWGTTGPDLEDNETRKKREREEKRRQRQEELSVKREERKSNAMKLGGKKLNS